MFVKDSYKNLILMPLLLYCHGRFYENVIKLTLSIIYLNPIKPDAQTPYDRF